MKEKLKIINGFAWILLTKEQTTALFDTNLFELYELHNDNTESLIGSKYELLECAMRGNEIAIEAGKIN